MRQLIANCCSGSRSPRNDNVQFAVVSQISCSASAHVPIICDCHCLFGFDNELNSYVMPDLHFVCRG